MAWKEIYRESSEEKVLEVDLSIGSSGATGTATIKYYVELVIEHDWLYGCSIFKTAQYLNVTSVMSPVKLYLGNGYSSTININGYGSRDSYMSDGMEIVPGSTYSDISICSWDMSNDKTTYAKTHRFVDGKFPLQVTAKTYIDVYDGYKTVGGVSVESIVGYLENSFSFSNANLVPIQDKGTKAVTADNFTDESTNPTVSYSIFTIGSKLSNWSTDYSQTMRLVHDYNDYSYLDYSGHDFETITLQVGLSLDGETLDIPYQDASIKGGSFTFNLTEEILEAFRIKAQGSDTVPVYYMFKTTRKLHYYEDHSRENDRLPSYTQVFYSKAQRNFTVVGCNPTLNPTVKDIKPETLALTGDENTFIRFESMAEYAFNATASKHATIVSQSVTCGSKTISNLSNGVIDDVESGTFIFNVTDSRNMGASSSVFKNLIEYVKPTCYQKAAIEITGETGATIILKVNGNYFNGSFGLANNTLALEVRRTDGNDNWGEWTSIAVTPTFNGTSYELETTFTGLDYGRSYIFQTRITDKLNVVESSQYIVSMKPVFDWGEKDFNFNVPVNINADDLNMYGNTIIRHSDSTNNTVLSANSGKIYLRPGGTDETDGETIFHQNGNVDFSGNANFNGGASFNGVANFNYSITVGGYILDDYVIETGSEAMGSNGTWYWRKWLSGKAEAWGCRNFGNMAVSTSWGNLYRSAIFTQDLPEDVFIRTPDAININFVHAGGAGWISKHEQTAPSAVTTGSFVVVRPVSGNITPTNIGFHVVGEWY